MATVAEVMNRDVLAVDPTASIGEAAEKMVDAGVGAVVVMEDMVRMVGIVTERDILRACAATRGPLESLKVADRMTRCPVVASLNDEVADVMCIMTERRIRHQHHRTAPLVFR